MEQYTVPVDDRALVYSVAAQSVARGTVNVCRRLSARDMLGNAVLRPERVGTRMTASLLALDNQQRMFFDLI